jgi:hypothetical protein
MAAPKELLLDEFYVKTLFPLQGTEPFLAYFALV